MRKTIRMVVMVTADQADAAAEVRKFVRDELRTALTWTGMKVRGVMPMPRDFPPRRAYKPREGIPPLLKAMGVGE